MFFFQIDIKTHKKPGATRKHRFITKKVIAITVPDVLSSFAITRVETESSFTQAPNLPSIAFLILSSSKACFFFDLLTFALGLPRCGPRSPNSFFFTPCSVFPSTVNPICMNGLWIISCEPMICFYLCF